MEKVLHVVRQPADGEDDSAFAKPHPRFALRTLGGLTLLGPDGREVESLATRRRKLVVLAWLAMRRTPATRDQIIGVFWGGRDEARARNSLADALSHIRRVLGRGAVPGFSERVALADDVPLMVDAAALTSAAAAGDAARVVELYAGDFLDGVHVGDSIEFERWRDAERARLAALFVRSAAARCVELARQRQWESCAQLARRWLNVEPASAEGALRLLEALAAPETHAARVAALVAVEDIRERLRRDLGVAPAPAVLERARKLAAMVAPAPERSVDATRSGPRSERSANIIGRARELRILSDAFARADEGRGNVVCISGEAGIGKTTLVESWLEDRAGESLWVMRGRCSERLAGAEAYLPLLDALDHLAAGRDGATGLAVLRHVAPLWHTQLSRGSQPGDGTSSPSPAPSQQQLKRELATLFQELSRTKPIVLFLDDVQWSDSATVDFLAYLATRLPALRLLVIATYRDEDLRAARHPFRLLELELETRGIARVQPLPFFSLEEVAGLAERELAPGAATLTLAADLLARTEGNPMFVAELVHELRRRMESSTQSPETLEQAARSLAGELPRSIRAMTRRKIERLSDEDRQLLIVASVQGVEFDAPVVAAAASLDATIVEERLDAIAGEDALIRRAGERAFSDGRAGTRYRFVHALYQDALYATLGSARRRTISLAVANAIVAQSAAPLAGMDAQLAFLYEAGNDPARALHHFVRAADDAARLFAHREVVVLCRRALDVVPSLPDTPERAVTTMRLHFSIGFSTMIVDGYGSPEAREAHTAAAVIAARLGDVASVFPLLAGLFGYFVVAGDASERGRVAARMGEIADVDPASPLVVMSELAGGLVLHASGDQEKANHTFEKAIARYDPAHHAMHLALYRLDPGVFSLAQSSRTLWLLGHADRALTRARQAVEVARELGDRGSIAFAMVFVAMVHQFRREAAEALASADETIAFCDAHEIGQERAWVLPVRGWATAAIGRTDHGIAITRDAIASYAATGAQHTLPYYHALLADALLTAGSPREAMVACDNGLDASARVGEAAYDGELHRLRAECLLRSRASDPEPDFESALRITRAQHARAFELRAATGLARLWRDRGDGGRSHALLGPTLSWFTEGLATPDVVDARRLLCELEPL